MFEQFNFNKKYLFVLLPVLLIFILLLISIGSKPKFTGSIPKKRDIAEYSAIRLNFNKNIENRDEIIKNLKIEPLVKVDVAVKDKQIIIVPIDYYIKNQTYKISVDKVSFGKSSIDNYVFEFKVTNNPGPSSSSGDIDEGDFVASKYPKFFALTKENNPHYKIKYQLDDKLIVYIEILEIKKIDEEIEDYYVTLDKYNNEVITKLKETDIDLNNVDIVYPNKLQSTRYAKSNQANQNNQTNQTTTNNNQPSGLQEDYDWFLFHPAHHNLSFAKEF